MKSLKTEDLNEIVFQLYPEAKESSLAKYCYIANMLWITMSEKDQKKLIKDLEKTLADKR
jgi:hypothetical protein